MKKEIPRYEMLDSEVQGEHAEAAIPYMREYPHSFVAEKVRRSCPTCNEFIAGFLGTLVWGIGHGEAQCGYCGHPIRMTHEVPFKRKDGMDDKICFEMMLPYHPSVLETVTIE